MANWTLLWASPPFKQIFESAKAVLIDAFLTKVPNFKEGSDHTLDSSQKVILRGGNGLEVTSKIELPSGATLSVLSGGIITSAAGSDVDFLEPIRVAGLNNNGSAIAVTDEISIADPITLTGTQPASNANPGANNRLHATNVAKAWGTIDFNEGTVTVEDGYNINTPTISISVQANVTFVRAMANDDYAVVFGVLRGAGPFLEYPIVVGVPATTGFSFNIRDLKDTTGTIMEPIDLDAEHPGRVYFAVFGRQ